MGSAGGYKSHSRYGRSCVMTSVETDFTKSTNSCVISYHIGRLKVKVQFTLQQATKGHKYRLSYSQIELVMFILLRRFYIPCLKSDMFRPFHGSSSG